MNQTNKIPQVTMHWTKRLPNGLPSTLLNVMGKAKNQQRQ